MALLWSLVFVDPLIIISTIFCGLVSLAASPFDSSGGFMIKTARVWARSLLAFAGVRVIVEGLEKIDPNASYVFASNHLSYMDTPVVLRSIPVEFRFMAKEGLFKIPFLGTHLKQAGHISVPRKDPRGSIKAMTQAADAIRTKGISVLVFPEGGRSRDGVLQPFKDGAAFIAIKAGVPVVPLALIGTRAVLPMHSGVFHRGTVKLRIGDPLPTDALTSRDRSTLTETIRAEVVAMLEK